MSTPLENIADWRHRAACRCEDPELFFPVGTPGPALVQVAAAGWVTAAGGIALWMWLIGIGLVVLLGTSTASVLVALLLVGVPAALHLLRRFGPAQPPAPATGLTALVVSPVPGTLSTPELCLAWRRSYLTLVELPAGPARGELVALRQSILDELERRDGEGFRRWLGAGARAGGDLARYLATGPGA